MNNSMKHKASDVRKNLIVLLTLSLIPTAGCVGEMEEPSVDPAEDVAMDSEAIKSGTIGDPAGERVLERRELKRVDKDGNEQQNFVAPTNYWASGTSNATANTVNFDINLVAGDTLTIGTCGLVGATSWGDTYLRLYNPSGGQVALNDDACGSASKIVYTAPTSGTYQVRAGCYSYYTCGGQLAYSLSAPLFSYSASNTNNATVNSTNVALNLGSFNSLKFGTCGIPGASGFGDTYLRLYDANNTLVVSNDDACGALSQLVIPGGSLPPGQYFLRAGCFGNTACNGTVAYSLE